MIWLLPSCSLEKLRYMAAVDSPTWMSIVGGRAPDGSWLRTLSILEITWAIAALGS